MPGLHQFAWEPAPEKKMPFNPFGPLVAKIAAGVSLVLLIACVGLLFWGKAGWRDAASYKVANATMKKAYSAAQAAAEAEQKAYYASISARLSDKARFADESNRIAQDRARPAVSGYVERMRLAPGCAPRQAGSGAQDRPAEHRDGQGGEAEYVAVSRNDFELMVSHSVRLEEVRKWGESLISEGLAVPDPAFARQ